MGDAGAYRPGDKSRERLERYEALKAQSGPAEKSTLELNARPAV